MSLIIVTNNLNYSDKLEADVKKIYLKEFTKDYSFPFFIQYGKHDEKMILHSHGDFSELVIILEGSATHIVGNEKFQISKGDVFVISNDTVHGYEAAENFRLCNIMFRMSEVFTKSYDLWNIPGFHALFVIEPYMTKDHSFQSYLKLSISQLEELEMQLDKMINEYSKKLDGMKTLLLNTFTLIALDLSRLYPVDLKIQKQPLLHLSKAVAYLERNYGNDITVEILANQANLSPRHFSRLFREIYKESPGSYLLNYRIQKAIELLDNKELSISEVAYQCGFNDSNYFSRQFHKNTGFAPREHRNRKGLTVQPSNYLY